MPGNNVISTYTNELLTKKNDFYFCYVDLDNFKVYNDYYGFDKGDKVLLFTSDIIKKLFSADKDNFIGHIGGDDFVIIIQSENYEEQLKQFINEFDNNIKQFYNSNDTRAGGIIAVGRDEQKRKYGFVSLSIGVVPSANQNFHSIFEISDTAVMVKKKAKSMIGSNYYIDQRKNSRSNDSDDSIGNKMVILLNEKNAYSSRTIKHFLTPFKFNIIESSTKETFVNQYIKNEPDVVILDINTKSISEIVIPIRNHEKKHNLKKTYILAICEELVQKDVIDIINSGVDNIITKPIDNAVILSKIKSIMNKNKHQRI